MEPMEKLMHFFFICGFGLLGAGIYGLSGSILASMTLPPSFLSLIMWYKIKFPS